MAGIVFIFIVANYISPEAYGKFAILFAHSNLLVVLSTVWVSQAVMRYVGSGIGGKSMGVIVLIALAIAAILSLLTSVFSSLFSWPIADKEIVSAYGLMALTLALSLNNTSSAYAVAFKRYRLYWISEVSRALLLIISIIVFAAFSNGISSLVLSYSLATGVPSAILLIYLRNDAVIFPSDLSFKEVLAKYSQYGLPMILWAGLQATQSIMERSVLSRALSEVNFGHFMTANDVIARGIGLVLMPIVILLHSQIMASAGHNVKLDKKIKNFLINGIFLVLLGGVILTVIILSGRDVVGFIVPGVRLLDLFTIFMMCISAIAWTLALIVHKPLELQKNTILMSTFLGAAIGLQWLLLNFFVAADMAELAMPLASFCAAFVYMFACLLFVKGSD